MSWPIVEWYVLTDSMGLERDFPPVGSVEKSQISPCPIRALSTSLDHIKAIDISSLTVELMNGSCGRTQ